MKSPEDWATFPMPSVHPVWNRPLDLSNCDREPVQFAGAIMPHGVLLFIAPADFRILGASANADAWFGSAVDELFGGHLDRIVAVDVRHTLENALAQITGPRHPRYLGCCQALRTSNLFDVFAHRSGDIFVLEFEAIPAAATHASPMQRFAEVTESIAALQSAGTWQEGMSIAVRELKRLGGFDSVVGVRLLADGCGHAVAEACAADFPSFLDKRFPHSDIPEPGRRQMLLMPVQHAPEHDYEPVPIIMAGRECHPRQIDLSWSILRSMSRMCSQYYLNMGARSRLLLTLADHGELWGFFSCLSATPRQVVYSDRLAYQSFAEMAALLLVEKESAEQHRKALEAKRSIAGLSAELALDKALPVALRHLPSRLLDILGITGAALCMDSRISCAGATPPVAMIKSMLPWLDLQEAVFVTDRLPSLFEAAAECPERATGLLAVRLMEPGQYLLGFRPEWLHEVLWAGDPVKPVVVDPDSGGQRLTPRGSFEVWKETVRGMARPWRSYEAEALADLQHAIVLSQHADKGRALQSLLERSNAELEAFAFIVSHDLQEPLRGIRNFSQFLRDRMGGRLEQQERAWLDTIMNLGGRMSSQIDALLQYSRAGQQGLDMQWVDINVLLQTVVENLSARIAETGARVDIPRLLPCILCDPIRTAAVFENLINNAIKYNDQAEKRVEINFLDGQVPTFFVRDNGIGIPERHQDAIFTIFRRLHGRNDYGGGTGAGLTITRKHIERQGGRVWLESTPGQGSTFYFTLGPGVEESIVKDAKSHV